MTISDFNDQERSAHIECEFSDLTEDERRNLRTYLINDKVILRKELRIETDETDNSKSIKTEYHGYQAEPVDSRLSISKIIDEHGTRPRWIEIAEDVGILEYVTNESGGVNKASYTKGLQIYLAENDVDREEPTLGETQALGIPQNLLRALPELFLLPAITDYSDEVNRRSTSTVFRRLMADLSDRIIQTDPRYQELESALNRVHELLNSNNEQDSVPRLTALSEVESSLRDVIKKLMPNVNSISLNVEVDTSKEVFSNGVNIKIDDGVLTDVLDKGHGLQRSLVFSLLQMLINSTHEQSATVRRSIILAIEEPELYIHPHSQRLIFNVLKEFAGLGLSDTNPKNGQVIYTTHSPAFVEVKEYERIGVVQKPSLSTGTIVRQAASGILEIESERKTFNMLTSFGLQHNEVFFSKFAIIVEGPEDAIGIIATARKLGRIKELPDELGLSIVVTNGKGSIPKFKKILNAFGISYSVLLEMDGRAESHVENQAIIDNLNGNPLERVPRRVEDFLGLGRHFKDQMHAMEYFSEPDNINAEYEVLVTGLLPSEERVG